MALGKIAIIVIATVFTVVGLGAAVLLSLIPAYLRDRSVPVSGISLHFLFLKQNTFHAFNCLKYLLSSEFNNTFAVFIFSLIKESIYIFRVSEMSLSSIEICKNSFIWTHA